MDADLIINGSSKALVQVSPFILDSILKSNSYNLGLDGTSFIPQKLQYDLFRKYNHKPELVIQIVSHSTLVKSQALSGAVKFAPYLDNTEVEDVTRRYVSFSNYDYLLPLIKYSGDPSAIVNGILNFIGLDAKKDSRYKGYLEKDVAWDYSFEKFIETNENGILIHLDSTSIDLFEKYIAKCKEDRVNIVLVYPPTYFESQNYIVNLTDIIAYYNNVSTEYQVPFLNYSKNEISFLKKYFYNSQHLNKKGAELFSERLALDLDSLKLMTRSKK